MGDAVVKLAARKEVVHASSDHQKVPIYPLCRRAGHSRCMLHAMRARRVRAPRTARLCRAGSLGRYGLHCSTTVCRKARGLVLLWRACVRTYIARPALLNTATGVLLNAPSGCSRTAQHSTAYAVGANAAAGGQRLRICCRSCTQAYTVGSAGLAHIGAVLLLPAATADLARRRYGAASVFLFQEL